MNTKFENKEWCHASSYDGTFSKVYFLNSFRLSAHILLCLTGLLVRIHEGSEFRELLDLHFECRSGSRFPFFQLNLE